MKLKMKLKMKLSYSYIGAGFKSLYKSFEALKNHNNRRVGIVVRHRFKAVFACTNYEWNTGLNFEGSAVKPAVKAK